MKPIVYFSIVFLAFACIVCVYCELTEDSTLERTKIDVAARWATVILVAYTCGYYAFLFVRSFNSKRSN